MKQYGAGSFCAVFKERMAHAAALRTEYARLPNRCHFDPDEDFKLHNDAKPPFNIYGSWTDLMHLYHWQVAKVFMLRGQKEVRYVVAGMV